MSEANDRQVGGDHYQSKFQPWDFIELNGIGYLDGNAIKYAARWRKKDGREDLEKAIHYVDKLMELHRAGLRGPRGTAPIADCVRFSEENNLTATEDTVVLFLARWRTLEDLRQGKLAILRLLTECDADEQEAREKRGEASAVLPCGEVSIEGEDGG